LAPRTSSMRIASCSAIALLLFCGALTSASSAVASPVVRAVGTRLELDKRPFHVYGFNYEFNGSHPSIDYMDRPTRPGLLRLRSDFAEAARLGANTVRIYVELHEVMAAPTSTRPRGLRALRRILREAERAGLLVDITGNLVWHIEESPAWYDALPEAARWQVQARLWRAVAAVGADRPNVLAYELTSEPVITDVDGWYGADLGHHYIQYIVRELGGRDPVQLARDWTRTLRDAIRSQDRRHLITIGLLPFRDCAFDPRNIADLVDLVTVHMYPAASDGGSALALIRYFASHGRPLLLGETFAFDRPTQETFLLAARRWLDGSLSFYDGRAPHEVITTAPADAAYRQNLISYLGLRTSLTASPARRPPP
jgi:Cellulase (glycosyl hydrolase family 5)